MALRALLRVGAAVFLVLSWSCAHRSGVPAFASSNNSGNSSDGSGNSSNNSGNSSRGSGESSRDSGNSSRSSNESSQSSNNSSGPGGSSDVNASSQNSSRNSTNASAQDTQASSGFVAASSLLLSTVATIGFAIYGTVRAAQPNEKAAKSAMVYLKANRHQLAQDLAIGAGPVIEDLASAAEIHPSRLERFSQLLKTHRRELLDWAKADRLTPVRAARFLSRIGELTVADPVLRVDYERFLARHPELG